MLSCLLLILGASQSFSFEGDAAQIVLRVMEDQEGHFPSEILPALRMAPVEITIRWRPKDRRLHAEAELVERMQSPLVRRICSARSWTDAEVENGRTTVTTGVDLSLMRSGFLARIVTGRLELLLLAEKVKLIRRAVEKGTER